jgi:hypothetical protein
MAQPQSRKKKPTEAKTPSGGATRKTSSEGAQGPFPDDQFRLMVEAVVDYAIYMLDPEGRIVELEPRRATLERILRGRSNRQALFNVLPGGGYPSG